MGSGIILVTTPPTSLALTGFLQISPAEINIKHQLALIATLARAFGNVALYAGGGPALFDVETNFINGIPFATSSGTTFATSVPLTVLNDNWVLGGAAQVGATYAFAHWFLDVSYTYARSVNLTIINSVSVHNQIGPLTGFGPAVLTDFGPAVLNTQERVTNQSVMLTLNYQFH
jgi:hypothetical protein